MAVTTFIPLLEPIAGAGLAVSLAYLALDRFRYRDSVENHASDKRRQFASANDDDTMEVVKDLRWLCRAECNGHTPRGFGANFYHYIFRNKADEIVIATLAALAGFTLITGVGLSSKTWPWASFLDGPSVSTFLFYACASAIVLPALAVLCGRRSVKWGKGFADHCGTEISKIHQRSARAASVPATHVTPDMARRMRERAEIARRSQNNEPR